MTIALEEANRAFSLGEVPVGAVLARGDGQVLAKAHNHPIGLCDPTAHAEILALRKAASSCRNYRLTDTVLVVTLEPCLMCMGAAIHSRIATLVYGAPDPKAGAAGSVYDLTTDARLNHRVKVVKGVREEECRALMQDFFRARRHRDGESDAGEVPKWS